jgi:hypothetical protein
MKTNKAITSAKAVIHAIEVNLLLFTTAVQQELLAPDIEELIESIEITHKGIFITPSDNPHKLGKLLSEVLFLIFTRSAREEQGLYQWVSSIRDTPIVILANEYHFADYTGTIAPCHPVTTQP